MADADNALLVTRENIEAQGLMAVAARRVIKGQAHVRLAQLVEASPGASPSALPRDRSGPRGAVGGRLAFGLGCRPGDGVRLGGDLAVPRGPGLRELGAEEQDQG